MRLRFAGIAVALGLLLPGCSFHGLQGVYDQEHKGVQRLDRISWQLSQIEQELRRR